MNRPDKRNRGGPEPDDLAMWAVAAGMDLAQQPAIAVGFSGGPDSTALVWLFSQLHALGKGPAIQALTVDHDLRAGSHEEAIMAGSAIAGWPGVSHRVLRRPAPEQSGRIMERARQDRYRMLAGFCQDHVIRHLFVAHHRDDQAETILFRLAKGSGLDGLAGMRPLTPLSNGVMLGRPLLDYPKQALIDLCHFHALSYIEDPSNRNDHFARPRLRKAMESLKQEGLSPDRLANVVLRLQKSAQALQYIAEKASKECVIEKNANRIVLKFTSLKNWPDDIRYRVVRQCCGELLPKSGAESYGPRMHRLEDIVAAFFADPPQRRATLGGCLFTLGLKDGTLTIEREAALSGNACSGPQKA
jgi:tRNA(Ile)-lysidine synthase